SLALKPVQGNKILEILALGDEPVDDRIRIAIAERHTAEHNLIIAEGKMFLQRLRPAGPGLLRTGIQAIFLRQQHDILHEHADIGILPDLHLAVEHEEEPDRRIEEAEIARELPELA